MIPLLEIFRRSTEIMKYFLGFLVTVGLIVGVFVLILHGFSGSKKPTAQALVNYASSNRTVQETITGPLTTDDQHYTLRLTVGQSQITLEALHGYNEAVTQTYVYANNQAAYAEFLRALDLAGFTKGNAKANQDDRGFCSAGRRYHFVINDGANTAQDYWTSSCGGGNFSGNLTGVKDLFITQVPDFNKVSGLVSL